MQKIKNFILIVTFILFILFINVQDMVTKKILFVLLLIALLIGFIAGATE